MNRRDTLLILLAFGATPLDSRAQQPERARRIGVLLGLDENDSDAQLRLVAFKEGLAGLGWAERRNLTFDVRWSALELDRVAGFAKELVALKPDVILAHTTPVTAALQRETRSVPVALTAYIRPIETMNVAMATMVVP